MTNKSTTLSPLFLLLTTTVLLLFILPVSSLSSNSNIKPPSSPPFRHRYCDSFPSKYPPSICNTQFRKYLVFPPPPPHPAVPSSPMSSSAEIDPLYGVDKRLVPGGPDSMHH
ncbi:hypothetical protein SOVF_191800 [Spinacia oleracea]|nr:hypothetical protein SOVF_191800 [Spinacia oleracea]